MNQYLDHPLLPQIGDLITFEGGYEPEGPWGWLMRRLGKRMVRRKLRQYTVTFADARMTYYEPKSQGDEG